MKSKASTTIEFEKIKAWIQEHKMLLLHVRANENPRHLRYRIITRTQGLYFFMAGPDARRFEAMQSCWFGGSSMTKSQWKQMIRHDEREEIHTFKITALTGKTLWEKKREPKRKAAARKNSKSARRAPENRRRVRR